LIEAIRQVNAGESVLHPAIARKVVDRFAHPPSKPPEESVLGQLTERELEVLKLAAKGMNNKDIARHLSLSTRTIQAHLSTVFSKMQVGSRTEAVVQALQKGWLTLEDTL
jgi:DNA-binding NarL/FixJ family response regulator